MSLGDDIKALGHGLLALFNAAPAAAQSVLAVCTDPKGRGFETTPAKGWVFNRLKGAVLTFHNNSFGRPEKLVRYLAGQSGTVKLRPDHKLVLIREWNDQEAKLKGVRDSISEIAKLAA